MGMTPSRTVVLALAAAGTLSLCACATSKTPGPPDPTTSKAPLTPLDQFHAAVRPATDRLALAPHPGGALSASQKAALSAMLQKAADDSEAAIEISYADTDPDSSDAARMSREAEAYLSQSAALSASPAGRIKMSRYTADGATAAAPVVVSLVTVEAVGPNCRGHWGNMAATGDNNVTKHFGCAAAANLAAMVADPRDLQHPSAETPSDAGRRAVILAKYRKGDVTSSAKDEQASGTVSQAVK